MSADTITPTQDLIMEVLVARKRLGEQIWPFSTKHRKAIRGLQEIGFVTADHGIVENTLNVSLTAEGCRAYMSGTYEPPNDDQDDNQDDDRPATAVEIRQFLEMVSALKHKGM